MIGKMKLEWTLSLCLAGVVTVSAQIPGLGGGPPKIPGVDSLFQKGPAITTALTDAKWEVKDKDDFNPQCGDLFSLATAPEGGFVLRAGGWEGTVQSYCLHAGTHGPGGGDGYLYAPVKGPFENAVSSVGRNSVNHPEIQQQTVQQLLWAMVARTKFLDLPRGLQDAAAKLLTSKQISDINGGALGFLTDDRLGGALVKQPPFVRQVMEAENRLRGLLTNPASTYSEMEAVAVLTGAVERGKGSRDVPSNRWSLHPDGYYIRYKPSGYPTTHIEIYVPEGSKAIGKTWDPAKQIAVPGNTNRQRLLQTARKQRS